mgnify:CR=1 FL=1
MFHRLRKGSRSPSLFMAIILSLSCAFLIAQDAAPQDYPQTPQTPVAPGAAEQPASEAQTMPADAAEAEQVPAPASQPAEDEARVNVQPSGAFDVKFQDTDIRLALRLLSTQTRRNIVTTNEVAGTVTATLYGVTFKEALESVLRGGGFVYQEKGNFIYVMTPTQLAEQIQSLRQLEVRTFRLSHVTAADAKMLVAPALSKDGSIAMTPAAATGIPTSKIDAGGNSHANDDLLVVKDYAENLNSVAEIVRQIDRQPEQVLIEATILRATLTEKNQLGIDFNTLAGVNFSGLNATTAGLTKLTTATVNASNFSSSAGTVRTDFNSSIDSGGLSMGLVTNDIAVFIRALEGVTDVTVLANPKLLVINKQRGEVMIGNRDGYLTTTVTETVATQTVQFLETGTRLVVRPFVGRDGVIRLEIHPEDSAGAVTQIGDFILPRETTTEVTSNVLVRDGHTIVIGGLFRENTNSQRNQVPVLGNVPYLGTLFRSTTDTTVREEVIILITPRVVRQAVEEAIGEQLKDDVERFRVGQRKGVRWWGRERLAQIHLRQARSDLAAGKREFALWNLDMALSLEPRFIEAIRLKERLTETAYWADEGRQSAAKYVIERMIMQELNLPVEQVIPPARPLDTGRLDQSIRNAFGIVPPPDVPLELLIPPYQIENQEQYAPPTPPAAVDAQVKPATVVVDVNDEAISPQAPNAAEARTEEDHDQQ